MGYSMKDKVLKAILILLGIICILYCSVVILIIGTGHWFNFAFGIVGIVLLVDGIILSKLKELNRKCPKALSVVIFLIMALCLTNFGIFEVKAIVTGNSIPEKNAAFMIVLGAKVNGSTPSLEFSKRIEEGIKYAKENPNTKIVLTGGKGADENISESEAARNAFLNAGIDESRIYIETKSISTDENFKYAGKIIEKEGSKDQLCLVVSSQFHLYRASKLAEKYGFSRVSGLGSVGLKVLLPQYYAREYAAYIAESKRF